MYKNRIRPISTNLDVQSFIRRSDIEFDKRARYVEFVCNVWNEGRFGPDLADPVLVNWHDRPDLEPASFLDLDETGQCWPHCLHPVISHPSALKRFLGRAGFRAFEAAFRRAKQMELIDGFPIARFPRRPDPKLGTRLSVNQRCFVLPQHQRCVVIQPAAPPQER